MDSHMTDGLTVSIGAARELAAGEVGIPCVENTKSFLGS
jgi:hypothetical protein